MSVERSGARAPERAREDLEGERSPGRIGRPPAGNGRRGVTDPTVEQGLEADAPIARDGDDRLWKRRRSEPSGGVGGNGKGATATVTWCGCGRVESFEGCEQASRGGASALPPPARGLRTAGWTVGNPGQRNATNPMTGSGMQQARAPPSGGSRRGGAKPRGRNGISEAGASGPIRLTRQGGTVEWTLGGMSVEGRTAPELWLGTPDESQERRSDTPRPGRQVSTLQGSQGPRVRSSSRVLRDERRWRGTVGTPRRPAGQPARSWRERGRPTTRYDGLAGDEPGI